MVWHRGLIVSMSKSDYMQWRNFVLGSVCGAGISVRKADDFWGPRAGCSMKNLPLPYCPDVELLSVDWALLSGSLWRRLPVALLCTSLFASLTAYNGLWKKKKCSHLPLPLSFIPSPSLTQSNIFFFSLVRSHMALVLELFLKLQQSQVFAQASRVNITICEGTSIQRACVDFLWSFWTSRDVWCAA